MSAPVPPVPGMEPYADRVRAGDWRGLLALGRFGLAARTWRLVEGEAADPEIDDALASLAEVEAAVRTKAAGRARQTLARLVSRPAELVDWASLEADLEVLETASAAVDQREAEAAREALTGLRTECFRAEREALLGTLAVLDGEGERAMAHFDAALALDPNHVRAWTNRGNVRLEAGDVGGAIGDYEQALRIDDAFANAYHNLGVAYRRQGQIGKSVAALRKAQRYAARSDAEAARAGLRGGRPGTAARGGRPGWRRWLWIAAGAAAVIWFLQQRGTI